MEVHSQEYQGQLGRHPTNTKEPESRNLDTYVYIFLELKAHEGRQQKIIQLHKLIFFQIELSIYNSIIK